MSYNIAVMIPTKGRPQWALRAVHYYKSINMVPYLCEGPHFLGAVYARMPFVKERYVVLSGDDDFHTFQLIELFPSPQGGAYWACSVGRAILLDHTVDEDGIMQVMASSYYRNHRFWALYSLSAFKECLEAALPFNDMNDKETAFVKKSQELGPMYINSDILQLIRGNHPLRVGFHAPMLRRFKFIYNIGQWIMSFSPSRFYSYHSLRRRNHPDHFIFINTLNKIGNWIKV